ncbi:MAG: DUF721 domain-containing protein [Isosphaeraceae bacterium]
MSNTSRRGPKELSDVLSELFAMRGYGRLRALSELEDAWNGAVGEAHCRQTRLGEIRRGVLTVTVAHPTLLEELAAFRKSELLKALRACGPGAAIQDIRFRVGPVEVEPDPDPGRDAAVRPTRRGREGPGGVRGRRRGPGPRGTDQEHAQDGS